MPEQHKGYWIMKTSVALLVICSFALSVVASGAVAGEIILPEPDLKSGKPLMQCMAQRRSLRRFDSRALPLQMVSEILYAADGINRKDGRKTVPTARNKQNQSVYAFTADGVYFYNNKTHSLVPVLKGDYRKICGKQSFHQKAPLVLLFVADMSAIGETPELQSLYAGNHSGHASQNVYLYAASKGLSTVVCGMLDRDLLKKTLKLEPSCQVIFSQPVAFPAK